MDDWAEARAQMVAAQLERRGIRDRRVLAAFDGIMVTAGAPHVPEALKTQLGDQARLIIPVEDSAYQVLRTITRRDSRLIEREGDPGTDTL